MHTQTVYKQIGFSSELYAQLQKRAKELGMSFAAYMRMLAADHVKEQVKEQKEAIPMVDEETEKQIGKALEDYKKGRYTEVKTKAELEAYLKTL